MPKILIIGATGFIGSNLLKRFETEKTPVRVLARSPHKVISKSDLTEVVLGDLDQIASLASALEGIEVIYYLAHAMADSGDFLEREQIQTQNLATLLKPHQRVIYLGGIIPKVELSKHLKSRKLVGEILHASQASVIEFRASIVIGRGSASFELIRALVQRIPVIILASWANAKCQPIALDDALTYLLKARDIHTQEKNKILNIAGSSALTYGELLKKYANSRNLKRPEIYIESFPKDLVEKILPIIVPEYAVVGCKLLASIELPTVLEDDEAERLFDLKCMSLEQALTKVEDDKLEEISLSEYTKYFSDANIPSYVIGDSIQLFVPLTIPIPMSESERNLKVKLIGEFKIFFKPQLQGLQIYIRPSFFFQSLGWVGLKHIMNFIQGVQNGKYPLLFKK